MKFEVLKKDNLKRNIIIGTFVVLIISAVVLNFTRAKYRSTASVPIVNSEVNYVRPDLDVVALYIDGEQANELDSSKNYTLDPNNSTCTYKDGTNIDNLTLSYDSETKTFTMAPYTTRGTKCTLYFEEYIPSIKDTILTYYPTVLTRTNFSTTITDTTTGTIYKSVDESQYDNDGEVYYFAGNPTDNWVYFAGFYWRIIRINGDGTIRMIYQGTSANATGTGTRIETSAFNSSYSRNEYVGYMYTLNQVHGTGRYSNIKGVLDNWYDDNLRTYADNIDIDAGFCGDRSPSTSTSSSNDSGGWGTTQTYYGGYIRYYNNGTPTFRCSNSSDLYTVSSSNKGNKALTYPIGLITLDEVWYAGGNQSNNNSYYLYTGSRYWTMSPFLFDGSNAGVFRVNSTGSLDYDHVHYSNSVRPVINLRSDVTIIHGTGTSTDPFVITE